MRHHISFECTRLLIAVAVVSAVACATIGGIFHPQVAHACPMKADCASYNFPYSHSWYITDVNTDAIIQLAEGDASWSSNTCANNPGIGNVDFLTILDFGRPGLVNGVYQVLDFGYWQTYSKVQQVAELYADTWYNSATSCPRLHLVIGTANDYECYNGNYVPACNPNTAGQQWDALAHNVETSVSNEGHAWQETIWTGDDLEGGWDQWTGCATCYPKTQDFVTGLNNQENSYSGYHALIVDYGDAGFDEPNIENGPYWTPQNTYDAAWGIGHDVPVAEIYVQSQLDRWACIVANNCGTPYCSTNCGVSKGSQIVFYGAQSECSELDTLPTGNCWVQRSNACQWSPYEAYTNLYGATNGNSGNNITYTDNIRWQLDQPSSNNGC